MHESPSYTEAFEPKSEFESAYGENGGIFRIDFSKTLDCTGNDENHAMLNQLLFERCRLHGVCQAHNVILPLDGEQFGANPDTKAIAFHRDGMDRKAALRFYTEIGRDTPLKVGTSANVALGTRDALSTVDPSKKLFGLDHMKFERKLEEVLDELNTCFDEGNQLVSAEKLTICDMNIRQVNDVSAQLGDISDPLLHKIQVHTKSVEIGYEPHVATSVSNQLLHARQYRDPPLTTEQIQAVKVMYLNKAA